MIFLVCGGQSLRTIVRGLRTLFIQPDQDGHITTILDGQSEDPVWFWKCESKNNKTTNLIGQENIGFIHSDIFQ